MEEVRLVVVMDVVVVLDIMVLRVVMVVMVLVLVMMLVLWLVMVSSPKEEGRWPAVAIACCIAAACNKKNMKLWNSPGRIFRLLHIKVGACVFDCIPFLLSVLWRMCMMAN